MTPDPILFIGGCLFLGIAWLGRFDPPRLWRLLSLERGWRRRNPEQPADWERIARRYALGCSVMGLLSLAASVVLTGQG